MNHIINELLKTLPEKPGSYQMLDKAGKIIYVGKAKNLKNRVSSYFVGVRDAKTSMLVKDIEDIKYIITNSEKEALLLELNLIKNYMPKYNIALMGSTTYPYIEITDELYPRLRITRNVKKNKKNCFGPFPDATSANQTLKTLNIIFPFRKFEKMPKKVCLYYFIKQCLGPCEFDIDPAIYKEMRRDVRKFLSGNTKKYIDEYVAKMQEHSIKLEFEKAAEYKNLINAIQKTTEQQEVIFQDNLNRDIINFISYDNYISVNILFMRQGRLLFSKSKILSYYLDPEEVLIQYLVELYDKNLKPDEILLPTGYDYDVFKEMFGDIIFVPKRGKKMRLIEMAKKNASQYMENNLNSYLSKENKTINALTELEEALKIKSIRRIDVFDNSNTAGQDLVSAMVVFTNGLPNKKQYRKYKIKTVTNGDDYHMMQEVLYRRYQNMLVEDAERPDLIIVDGGIHQLRAGKEVLKTLNLDIPIIGLKKNQLHKTDSIIDWEEKIIALDKRSNLYQLLYKIQEEVHRFAINFHRNVASKSIYASILDTIPKVGKVTKEKLLRKYKNLENIKKAPRSELKALKITDDAIDNIFLALKDVTSK
ncbi:MAG: excinuclease ABC subunit UvrC [Tenericutes bacterium]|nr:excinuclease ABC subunit UvrC [Mycoplasmatota bacterium]